MKISKLSFKLEFDQVHDLEHMLLLKVEIDEMQVNIFKFYTYLHILQVYRIDIHEISRHSFRYH